MRGRLELVWLLLPVAVAVLAHSTGLGNGFTNWDDPLYLLSNPLTVDPMRDGIGGLLMTESIGYPVPVTTLVLAAERSAFGLDPTAFHAVSLALHLLMVLAVVALARRLGASLLGAVVAASLFAAHPIVVEPVAWVVGQKDLLAALLLVTALVIRAGPRGESPGRVAAAVGLVLLSLAAKPNTVAAPLLLLGVDLVLRRDIGQRRAWLLYGATAALAVAASWLAMRGHGSLGAAPSNNFSARSLAEAAWAVTLQAGHVVWPDPLTARYFAPDRLWLHGIVGVMVIGLLGLGAALFWKKDQRAVSFGILGALAAYAPTSGLVPLTRGPADSYMYLPLGLATVAVAMGLGSLLGRGRNAVIATGCAVAVVLGVYVTMSRAQAKTWKDAPTLWTEVAAAYPDEPVALMRMGDAYLFMGKPAVSIRIYEEIERRFPQFVTSRIAHGSALEAMSRWTDAERVLADGARRAESDRFRDRYGFFLIAHPRIEPSDPIAAARSIELIAPLLAARGKRPAGVQRAITLLERYDRRTHVEALRRRLVELQRRR